MHLYALIAAALYLCFWGFIVRNAGNWLSFCIVKVLPTVIGLWCLWEVFVIFFGLSY